MKITRSSKCSLKYMTTEKADIIESILSEYSRIVNFFIELFWQKTPSKAALLKDIVNRPHTWLTARFRKVAAREAIDMIIASKKRFGDKAKLPMHKGTRMYVSSTIATLLPPKRAKEYDAWLHLSSIGNQIALDLPIRFHKHFHKLSQKGKRLESYIITKHYVQFSFEIETGPKKNDGDMRGVDTGIHALAALDDGKQFGHLNSDLEAINRCQYGSKRQKQLRRALKQKICEIAKVVIKGAKLIVVEKLKRLNHCTKRERRLSKNVRRTFSSWTYRYWLNRLEMSCEWDRVSFRTVSPQYTSQRCSSCGYTERRNRDDREFLCKRCGYACNADVNAAKNILTRFLSGPYGAGFKPCPMCP
jgi:putative transposase